MKRVEIDSSMKRLFDGEDLFAFLERFFSDQAIAAKVRGYPRDRFVAASDAELQQYFMAMFALTPLQLREAHAFTDEYQDDDVHLDHRPGMVVVKGGQTPGLRFNLFIPYVGLRELWFMKPAGDGESHLYARLNEIDGGGAGTVEIPLVHPLGAAPEAVLPQRERFLSPIRSMVEAQAAQIQLFMSDLPVRVASAIAGRRSLHEVARRVQDVLAVPIRRSPFYSASGSHHSPDAGYAKSTVWYSP